MKRFRVAINMPGAISAGAYTAGVLDFLTEALDAWYAAKAQGDAVPNHDVSIDVFSGASAGGMCAAISAILLHDEFAHIHHEGETGTSNRLYESWVNRIDIRELLQREDLKTPGPVVSLLDSTIIDTIADYALARGTPSTPPRPYVSRDLTVFLSLTNLRGVVYMLTGVAPGSVEESTVFFGDRVRFQTVSGGSQLLAKGTYPIDLSQQTGVCELLCDAAKATGAFPLFLAPRVLLRRKTDYTPPVWQSYVAAAKDEPPPICPTFPAGLQEPFETLNVDGGMTDNDPFLYARDYLASLDPPPAGPAMVSNPHQADRAVLTIAPFPTRGVFSTHYDTKANSSIFRAVYRLFTALIAQSRFFGESLSQMMTGMTFSQFVIAPSDQDLADKYAGSDSAPPALQCATLGAFGGFFERGFRAHDYQLGRRNCQKFLLDHFILPENNELIREALLGLPPELRAQVVRKYARPAPRAPDGSLLIFPGECGITPQTVWLPVIPLCNSKVADDIPKVNRATMSDKSLDEVIDLIGRRFCAVTSALIGSIRHAPLRLFLRPGPGAIAFFGRGPLKQALIKALGDSYSGSEPTSGSNAVP